MAVDCMSWCLQGTSASEALLLLSTSASSIDTLLDILRTRDRKYRYAVRDQWSVSIPSDLRAFQFDGHKIISGKHRVNGHPCLTRDLTSDFSMQVEFLYNDQDKDEACFQHLDCIDSNNTDVACVSQNGYSHPSVPSLITITHAHPMPRSPRGQHLVQFRVPNRPNHHGTAAWLPAALFTRASILAPSVAVPSTLAPISPALPPSNIS